MNYTKINELYISKITLGTAQLGLKYGIANKSGKPDINTCYEILKKAVEGGVNSFDTAELYGDSEATIGNFFSTIVRDSKRPIFISKFYSMINENMRRIDMERQIYKKIEMSLERLKIKRLPVCIIHEPSDMNICNNVVPDTLKKFKTEGLIDRVGVSVYTCHEVDEMLKNDLFDVIQIPLNIMDQRLISSGAISKLTRKNILIFARSIFLQGLFFLKPEELADDLRAAGKNIRELNKLAEREGVSVAQLAVSYVRDIEGIASLVIGAETVAQVEENLKLIDAPPITEKTRNEIMELFKDIPENILNPGFWKASAH